MKLFWGLSWRQYSLYEQGGHAVKQCWKERCIRALQLAFLSEPSIFALCLVSMQIRYRTPANCALGVRGVRKGFNGAMLFRTVHTWHSFRSFPFFFVYIKGDIVCNLHLLCRNVICRQYRSSNLFRYSQLRHGSHNTQLYARY